MDHWSNWNSVNVLCDLLLIEPSVFVLQDNYTFAQPGIQKKVKALEELVSRIDGRWEEIQIAEEEELAEFLLFISPAEL